MSESKAHQVEIREVDGLTLRKLVDYIYTAEIEVTEDNVQVSAEETEQKVLSCVSVCQLGLLPRQQRQGFSFLLVLWWTARVK